MSYVIVQLALSLDGYIARKNGDVDFLGDMNTEFTEEFNSFVHSIDTIIMGRGTYEKMLEFGEMPFKNKKIYVLTKQKLKSNEPHVTFTKTNISSLCQEIDGNIWLFGGSKVIKSFINLGLVDEFQLLYVPQIIGEGIPMFLNSSGMKDLTLVKHEHYGDSLFVVYKK